MAALIHKLAALHLADLVDRIRELIAAVLDIHGGVAQRHDREVDYHTLVAVTVLGFTARGEGMYAATADDDLEVDALQRRAFLAGIGLGHLVEANHSDESRQTAPRACGPSPGCVSLFRFEVGVVSRSAGKAEEGGAPGWGHLPRAQRVGGGGDRR